MFLNSVAIAIYYDTTVEKYDVKKIHYIIISKEKGCMILETKRLYLREMKQSDFLSLCKILQNKDVMYAYEHA